MISEHQEEIQKLLRNLNEVKLKLKWTNEQKHKFILARELLESILE